MNNRPEDNQNMSPKRNHNSSVDGHPVRQPSGQSQTSYSAPRKQIPHQPQRQAVPVKNAAGRPVQRPAQNTVKRVPQKTSQRPVARAVKTAPKKQETKMNKSIVKLLIFAAAMLLMVLLVAGAVSFINGD